jgi:choice-of-anchor B domain-containing protein
MTRGQRFVLTGGFLGGAVFLGAANAALACYGVPCAPTSCVAAGLGISHTHADPHASSPLTRGGPVGGPVAAAAKNMTLLGNLSLTAMGGLPGGGSSLYGWTDPLTKREYAIMGLSNGTAFVDITNPRNPTHVATLPKVVGSSNQLWREPKVYQNTVYIGVDGTTHGMQIMDLTKLRAYSGGAALQLTADNVYNGVTRIHTLAINPTSGFLYLAGTNANGGGLRVMNVGANQLNPAVAGNTNLDGYTHETQVITYSGPDTQHQGKEIAFNSNGPAGVLSILDVTNKSAITRIAARTYTGERYIHQGWVTEDQKYFFQNDELDEPNPAARTRTHLWNIQDLDNPVYRGFFEHTTSSVDHNLYVKDGFVFESNYTTGLRMLKIGNLESSNPNDWLKEVAFYDTYAPNDGASFNGAWNNYPFFKSGVVAVSDINGGLFLIRPDVRGWNYGGIDGPIPPGGPAGPGGPGTDVPEPAAAGLLCLVGTAMLARRRG